MDQQQPKAAPAEDSVVAEFTGITHFNDRDDHKWELALDLASAKRIENSDFSEMGYKKKISFVIPEKEFLTDCISNTGLIFAMVWAVIQPQIEDQFELIEFDPKKVGKKPPEGKWPKDEHGDPDENEFLRRMNGKAIEDAKEAWWEAVADFFPQHRIILWRLISMFKKAQATVKEKVDQHIGEFQTTIDQVMGQEIEKGLAEIREEIGTRFSK